ncbi:MAG: ribosomal-processing cysteine protease Prp, partial [Spirochaetales bacterium]|nr:ribosomal-processing cysteine protease Prp [Spirochaetales bacterium]
MINVTLWLDQSGSLLGVDASGHSGSAAKGNDIICSAASALLRTVSRILEIEPSVELVGSIEEQGELHLRLKLLEESKREWLGGVSSFTVLGLKDLEA